MAMHTPRSDASLAEPTPAPPPTRLWQVPTFLAGLLAVAAVYLARPLWRPAEAHGPDDTLTTIRKLLEEPGADVEHLVALSQELIDRSEQRTQQAGEAHYLLGSALVRRAAGSSAEQAPALWRQARTHLEQAERLGVAAADQPRLRYRLAQAWLRTGGDKARILDALDQAIAFGADDRGEAFGLLTQAHLLAPADPKAALEANARQLAQPTADERVLAPARLQRGELFLQLKEFARAREALEHIGRSAPPSVLARARLLLGRCCQEEERWEQAAAVWEQVLADRDHPPPDPGLVAYDLGTCYRRLPGRAKEAEHAWRRALPHGGAAAQAAALRLAELLLQEKPGEDVLPLLHQAPGPVAHPEEYSNPFISLVEVRALLERGCALYREAGAYERAREVARVLEKTGATARAHLLVGELTAAWAAKVLEQDAEQARALFREAGRAFEQAAGIGTPAAAPLLHGAECFRQARAAADVVRVLDQFVRQPDLPDRKGEAWFRLGEAQETLGQADQARGAYTKCLEFGGPFEHHARFRLATFEVTAGNEDAAINQFIANIGMLERLPEEGRDRELTVNTLVTLGDLLVRQGQQQRYKEAEFRYTQALVYAGNTPAAWPVRFRLGECYRFLAQAALAQREQALEPNVKKARDDQRRSYLEGAAKAFEKLEEELLAAQKAHGSLSAGPQALLDSLGFRIAGARFDRGEFPEALTRYADLAEKRRGTLEELVAWEGIAWCHRQAGAADRLRETLERMQAAVRGLPGTVFTGKSDREKRTYWETELPRRLAGAAP